MGITTNLKKKSEGDQSITITGVNTHYAHELGTWTGEMSWVTGNLIEIIINCHVGTIDVINLSKNLKCNFTFIDSGAFKDLET